MAIRHLSYVVCDVCGDPAEAVDGAKEARKEARRQGYVRIDGRDLCIRHRPDSEAAKKARAELGRMM